MASVAMSTRMHNRVWPTRRNPLYDVLDRKCAGLLCWEPLAIDLDGTKGGYANRRLPTAALG
jgi:hypothetical protein